MAATRNPLVRRSLRWFTLGSGPLKRPSDRLQLVGRLVVLLSVLVAPPLAVAAASATTVHFEAVAEAQAAERSEVRALLLEDAPAVTPADVAGGNTTARARAVWTAPDGTVREGDVAVDPRTPAGTDVQVWVERDGDPTRAPLDPAAIPASAAATAVLLLIGLPVAVWFLHVLLCTVLDATRERRWERDWASVAPRWTAELR